MAENNLDDGNLNQDLVNQAKDHFEQKKWEKAVSLFEQSMEICKRNEWNEGIEFANKMISECNIHIQEIEKKREIEIKKAKEEADQITAKEESTQKAKAEAEKNAEEKAEVEVEEKVKIEANKRIPDKIIKIERDNDIRQANAEADKMRDREILIQRGDGRLQCPKCKNSNRNMTREVEDRTRIIMDYPLIFGKKYICGQCGIEWRREE